MSPSIRTQFPVFHDKVGFLCIFEIVLSHNLQDCMHESFRNSLPLHSVGVEDDHTGLENSESSTNAYSILGIDGR